MARIRTIKPEFWTSEQVVELSPLARLAFIGLWNFCDDYGVHPASAKRLKMEVFPADAIEVKPLIQEMITADLIREFEAQGKSWWHVTGWQSHQKISHPAFRFPEPPGWEATVFAPEDSGTLQRIPEHSALKGREGKGIEGKGYSASAALDASAIDWEQARGTANAAVVSLGCKPSKTQDRVLLLRGAALEQFYPRVFVDAVDATRLAFLHSPPKRSRFAYLTAAISGKLKDLGRDPVEVMRSISVPDRFLKNGAA